jgi:hypothetical protein
VESQVAEEIPTVEKVEVPAASEEPAAGEPEPPVAAASGELSLDEIQRVWPMVLDKLSESAPALAATFEGVRPDGLEGDELSIGFPPDKTFNKRKAEGPERREALIAALVAVTGKTLRPTYDLLDAAPAAPEPADDDGIAADKPDGVSEEELLRRLKSEFDAEEVS